MAEILDLRYFTSTDLRCLLDHEVEAWRSRLHWDFRAVAEMILRYTETHVLPGVVAIDNGQVRGYCFFIADGVKGGIGDLYVSPGPNRQEIESSLALEAIHKLRQCGGLQRTESQLLIHNAGNLSQPFLDEGHQCFRRIFLSLPLTPERAAQAQPLSSEFVVHRWRKSFCEPAAAVITATYQGHIDSDLGDQYRTLEGALGFMHNIVRYPTCGLFDASASFLVSHRLTQQPVALLLCSRLAPNVGHVTQICTVPEFRGHGIGEFLLRACCQDLIVRGFGELSLTVTAENRRALALYQRFGFHYVHEFDAFVWQSC